LKRVLGALAGALFVSLAACVQILGADDPMRRQLGEPCTVDRDCTDGLQCVLRKCAMASPAGGSCTKAADCSDSTLYCNLCRCSPCATPGSCTDFVTCGRDCIMKCTLGQPCGIDDDCDMPSGYRCDIARSQCVSQNCKNPDGTYQCGIATCAPCSPAG